MYRNIVDEAQGFLEKGSAAGQATHYQLGLKILNMLVAEMNQPTAGRTLTQHRKTAVAFRWGLWVSVTKGVPISFYAHTPISREVRVLCWHAPDVTNGAASAPLTSPSLRLVRASNGVHWSLWLEC